MRGHSSPSLTPRKPRTAPAPAPAVSLPPSEKHPLIPPLSTVRRRRTEIAFIEDPKDRSQALSKRRKGLIKKASELHELTGAHVALTIVSKGNLHCVCKPSIEEMISTYRCGESGMLPKKGLGEWLDRAKKVCDSCKTKEDCASLIMEFQDVLNCLSKKLEDFENSPSVKAGAGDHSLEKNFETPHPSLENSPIGCDNNDDEDIYATLPTLVNLG